MWFTTKSVLRLRANVVVPFRLSANPDLGTLYRITTLGISLETSSKIADRSVAFSSSPLRFTQVRTASPHRRRRDKLRFARRLVVEPLESRRLLTIAPPIIFGLEDGALRDERVGAVYQLVPFSERGSSLSVDEHVTVSRDGYTAQARVKGDASFNTFEGTFHIEQDWHTQWLHDYRISAAATLVVYVRGSHGTPFYVDAKVEGSAFVHSYGPTGSAEASFAGVGTSAYLNSPNGDSVPISGRYFNPAAVATQGHPFDPFLFEFPEYPGVTYARAYATGISETIWSNIGVDYGDRVASDISIRVTATAHLRQGLAPVVLAAGATDAVAGVPTTWRSYSYDEDVVGGTRQDLYAQFWELLDPGDQVVATGSGLDFEFIPTGVGEYHLRFRGLDDEGMEASQTYAVQVANAIPSLALLDNVTLPLGSPPIQVELPIDDSNHPLSQLSIVAAASNPLLFPEGSVTVADLAEGKSLVLAPAPGVSGVSRITVTVTDPLGDLATRDFLTLVGDLSADQHSATLAGPGTQTIDEDTPLVFRSAGGPAVQVAPFPGGAANLRLSIGSTHGTITLNTADGLIFDNGDGISDSELIVRGSAAALNAALDGARYSPTADFHGDALVTFRVDDFGQSGLGIDLFSNWDVPVIVVPVADAPRIHAPAEVVWDGTTPLVLSQANGKGISIESPDVGWLYVKFHLAGGTATLTSRSGITVQKGDGIGDVDMHFFGETAAINNAIDQIQLMSISPIVEVTIEATDLDGHVSFSSLKVAPLNRISEHILRDHMSQREWWHTVGYADIDGIDGELTPTFMIDSFIGDGQVLKKVSIVVAGFRKEGSEWIPTDNLTPVSWVFGFYESGDVLLSDPLLVNQSPDSASRRLDLDEPTNSDPGQPEYYGNSIDTTDLFFLNQNLFLIEVDVEHLGIRTTSGREQFVTLTPNGNPDASIGPIIAKVASGAIGTGRDRVYQNFDGPEIVFLDQSCYYPCDISARPYESQSVLITSISDDQPPVNSVTASESTMQNVPLTLAAGAIVVSDPDARNSDLEMTLVASHGTLTLGSVANVSLVMGDGSDDPELKFTGTLAAINAALAVLMFTPEPGYHGAAAMTITSNDLGNTGAGGPKSDTDVIPITITPNTPPTDIRLSANSVFENTAGIVGELTTVDPDETNTHAYTILPGAHAAQFIIAGRQLRVGNAGLDFEAGATRTVRIRSTDQSGDFVDVDFTVQVQNVNEPPTEIRVAGAPVFEHVSGTVVGVLSAIDPESGDSHSFTTSDERFEILGTQLKLKPTSSFDFATGSTVSVSLTATEDGTPSRSLTSLVQISVQANPHPWHREPRPLDVNGDGTTAPVDALLVINELNIPALTNKGVLPAIRPALQGDLMLDTSGDSIVSPVDALLVINELNRLVAGEGERTTFDARSDEVAITTSAQTAVILAEPLNPGLVSEQSDLRAHVEADHATLASVEQLKIAACALPMSTGKTLGVEKSDKTAERRARELERVLGEIVLDICSDDRSV